MGSPNASCMSLPPIHPSFLSLACTWLPSAFLSAILTSCQRFLGIDRQSHLRVSLLAPSGFILDVSVSSYLLETMSAHCGYTLLVALLLCQHPRMKLPWSKVLAHPVSSGLANTVPSLLVFLRESSYQKMPWNLYSGPCGCQWCEQPLCPCWPLGKGEARKRLDNVPRDDRWVAISSKTLNQHI